MKTVKELKRFYVRTVALTVGLTVLACEIARHLIWNRTESMPLGWYWLHRGEHAARGDTVAFPIPASVRQMVHERGYLQDGAYLIKTVVALPGDRVCTEGAVLRVNGRSLGAVLEEDRAGRPLPHAEVCAAVEAGEVYVASEHPRSFDSRVFGAIRLGEIRGKVVALWTY